MESAYSVGSQTPRKQELRHGIQIMTCGGMIGTSVLFPLANIQGLWFRASTLSIFIITALVFAALRLEPLVRYGRFTVPVCLAILLLAVLAAGSTREGLIPWLPLFIASVSLITVTIDDVLRRIKRQSPSFSGDGVRSWASTEACSNYSLRSMSTEPQSQSTLGSTQNDRLLFARYGPPSRMSQRTDTIGTDITLSGVAPQFRPHWDVQTRSCFSANGIPNGEHLVGIDLRVASPEGSANLGADPERDSVADTAESSHPLLSPRRGLTL
ncbi:hypothetical protein VTH82DRAFT_3571 [Thermothelomyces myriococcoides]